MNTAIKALLRREGCCAMGRFRTRRELALAMRDDIHSAFSAAGDSLRDNTPPYYSRERLYFSETLFVCGGAADLRLANAIIRKTPCDDNRFLAFAALELLLDRADALTPAAREHLMDILRRHVANLIDMRFGSPGVNNIVLMATCCLLGCSQILDQYEWAHPVGSCPEVYTAGRLLQHGMNGLYAVGYCMEHEPILREWNSSAYAPLTVHALASIVERIDDPEAKAIALRTEAMVWRQILACWHPELDLLCGPYSWAYWGDMFQDTTGMHHVMTYLGLSRTRSFREWIARRAVARDIDGIEIDDWSMAIWYTNTRFHIPEDALRELSSRRYPVRHEHAIRWEPFGVLGSTATPTADHIPTKRPAPVFPAQGTAFPGGTGTAVWELYPHHAVGYRSAHTMQTDSHPLYLHYGTKSCPNPRRNVNTIVLGILHCGLGEQLSTTGAVDVWRANGRYHFSGSLPDTLRRLPFTEISLNCLIGMTAGMPETVSLCGKPFQDETVEHVGREAIVTLIHGDFRAEIGYTFAKPVTTRLFRWNNVLRLCATFQVNEERLPSAADLRLPKWEGWLRLRPATGK